MKLVIIGAGAAGMMAAITAARKGHRVTIIEKNEKVGKKIYITGKGRCNVTNDCEDENFFRAVKRNPRFLYSSYSEFNCVNAQELFEELGCPLKVERGNRVFPVSDKSSDVIRALENELKRLKVELLLNTAVTDILVSDATNSGADTIDSDATNSGVDTTDLYATNSGADTTDLYATNSGTDTIDFDDRPVFRAVRLSNGKKIEADACIVATGGLSYQTTGSTGDGYDFARKLGHNIKPCSPSLVAINLKEDVSGLEGLSLKNVSLTVRRPVEKKGKTTEKTIYNDFGEMVFTAKGISGPLVLSASAELAPLPLAGVTASIDLKPALSVEQLDARVLHDFNENSNKQFRNSLGDLLPQRMAEYVVAKSGIDPYIPVHQITAKQREAFVALLKALPFEVKSLAGYNEAVITCGGVDVKEINPATMESKLAKNIFFAGEVLDLDAVTGGYNLQIAWTTGHAAGNIDI